MSERFKNYTFEYEFNGSTWLVEIKAASLEEAKQRMHRMPMARPLGELVMKVPAGGGWLVKLLCVVRNFFADRP